MPKKYIVHLTDSERETLNQIMKKRGVAAQKVRRASILLKADLGGPGWADAKIADAFGCRTQTVENIRESLVAEGFETTLNGKPKRRARSKVLDGEQEAKIIALRLGQPPKGFSNWTLRLLAEQAVTLEIVESVSHETLRRTLKKTSLRSERSSIGSSLPSPMPSSPRAWRKCWMSTPGPTISDIPCCAWMNSRFSC